MNIRALTSRIDRAIAGLERQRIEQDATKIALQWIREGLYRKLALIDGDLQARPPDHFRDQCAAIDVIYPIKLAVSQETCHAAKAV